MTVEKKLNKEDSAKLAELGSQLRDLQIRYGQHALSFEEQKLRAEAELRALRAQTHQKSQELQAFSQQLMKQYDVSLETGNWSLDIDKGVFLGPPAPAKPIKARKKR